MEASLPAIERAGSAGTSVFVQEPHYHIFKIFSRDIEESHVSCFVDNRQRREAADIKKPGERSIEPPPVEEDRPSNSLEILETHHVPAIDIEGGSTDLQRLSSKGLLDSLEELHLLGRCRRCGIEEIQDENLSASFCEGIGIA